MLSCVRSLHSLDLRQLPLHICGQVIKLCAVCKCLLRLLLLWLTQQSPRLLPKGCCSWSTLKQAPSAEGTS